MTFDELMKVKDCHISFERIFELRTKEVKLRIIVNKSENPTDLLIFPHPESRVETLLIDFENYVSYSVIYDDFTSKSDNEVYRGEAFRIFDKSDYLNLIQKGSSLPSGKITHYSLLCFEHKVDIISNYQPVIREFTRILK
jgi:hypothetical protein